MDEFSQFKCSSCGQLHEDAFSFSFNSPAPFLEQSEDVQNKGELNSDFCYYEDEDGFHYFIRVVVEIPIHGRVDGFLWGAWVSLSQDSYEHYKATFETPEPDISYFGWFCNYLPYYEDTYALATSAHPRSNGRRPYLKIKNVENEFSYDFHNGISIDKARKLAEICLHEEL